MSKPKKSVFDMLSAVDAAASGEATKGNAIAIEDIQPDPNQPRRHFDTESLDNLAASIREYGVLQPIVVKHTGGLPPYVIVSGERRWRASQLAGLVEIPATVREGDTDTVTGIVQLVENMNREDLSDLEVAEQIQRLIDQSGDPEQFGLKSKIAASLNRKPSDISRLLTMLETAWLPLVKEGIITSADALSRFRACPPELQAALIDDARASGDVITSGTVRTARKAWDAPAAATVANAADGAADASAATADGVGDVAGDQVSTADLAGSLEADASTDEGENDADADSDGDGDGDADSSGDDSASHYGGDVGAAGVESNAGGGDATGGKASSASGSARGKAVELQLTGEKIEVMLRYLVDKASDRLNVKVPHDLAVAIIENLGGEVPEDASLHATMILTLLDRKVT